MDADINRGSYLFNFRDLTEDTVDDWINLAKSLGAKQINLHGGQSKNSSFSFGDFQPNPKFYPNGYDSLKAVVDKIHEAGLKAGMQTYAFFIQKRSPYVTPVPDPRLGKDASA